MANLPWMRLKLQTAVGSEGSYKYEKDRSKATVDAVFLKLLLFPPLHPNKLDLLPDTVQS